MAMDKLSGCSTGGQARRRNPARSSARPGIFHRDQPAQTLFSHFGVVAKQVTHLHYSEDLGLVFDAVNLRPMREREG